MRRAQNLRELLLEGLSLAHDGLLAAPVVVVTKNGERFYVTGATKADHGEQGPQELSGKQVFTIDIEPVRS